MLDDWVGAVCAELGIDIGTNNAVDRNLILDMARDVAHGVARPAAPLTAYLVGLAAGRSADPAAATAEAITQVAALIETWPPSPPLTLPPPR